MTEHPPGWHPDPRGRHEHRYWDGTKWTDHVADGGVTGTDAFDAETVEVAAPFGPSMVNLPAIDPSLLQRPADPQPEPEPERQPAAAAPPPEPSAAPATQPEPAAGGIAVPTPAAGAEPPPGGGGPSHREQKGPEDALESVSDAFENAAASMAHKPGSLAALLTVAAPGMGHVYLGVKRTTAYILLAATVAAVILSCFISFPIALLVYLAALAFAFVDLREALAPMQQSRASSGPLGMFSDLGRGLSWRLVIVGGALLALSLLLPWYRQAIGGVSVTISGFDALKLIDLILLVIGAGSAVLGVMNLNQGTDQRPVAGQIGTLVAAAGALAFVLVLFRLLFVPDGGLELGIERSFGILLAFASSVLLAGGAAGAATSKS